MARVEGEDRERSPDERQAGRGSTERRPAGEDSFRQSSSHDEEAVRRRAYELYEQRGREGGRDMDNWLDAERELASGEGDQARDADDVRGEGARSDEAPVAERGSEARGERVADVSRGDGAPIAEATTTDGRGESRADSPPARRSTPARKAPARKQRPPRAD